MQKKFKKTAIATLIYSMAFVLGQPALAAPVMADNDMPGMPGMDHSSMGHESPPPAQTDDMGGMDHSQMGHNTQAEKTKKTGDDMQGMDHSGMGHESPPPAQTDDMGGMDHSQMGHNTQAEKTKKTGDDMQGMDHSGGGEKKPMSMQGGVAPADARDPHAYSGGYDFGPIPPPKMADEAYMGGLMINRLERVQSRTDTFTMYDFMGRFGKDYDQLVLKAEGEVAEGKLKEARTELLWGHAVATYWNTQLGIRHDSGLEPSKSWLAFGVQGLAPYWFEVDAAAYIGAQGAAALRLGAEYELLLTQKLVLQPRIETNFYSQRDAARKLGAGLSSLVTGVRLRYEIRREFAPYVGVEWSGKYGETADYAREEGMRTNNTRVVAGVRFWF